MASSIPAKANFFIAVSSFVVVVLFGRRPVRQTFRDAHKSRACAQEMSKM
jgi:hypothetical protein